MNRRSALAAAVLLTLAVPRLSHAASPVPLWNGKDLSNWTFFLVDPQAKMENTWSVRDGMIVCKGDPVGTLLTKDTYTSFKLVVEWRWTPGTLVTKEKTPNSGVLLRINGEMKQIPRSIEAQLRSGDAGDLYGFWGMKIEGDRPYSKNEKGNPILGDFVGLTKRTPAENPVGQWNRYEIVLDGTKLDLTINGAKVNSATVTDVIPGRIGLQSEGGEIHFRKVELQPLP